MLGVTRLHDLALMARRSLVPGNLQESAGGPHLHDRVAGEPTREVLSTWAGQVRPAQSWRRTQVARPLHGQLAWLRFASARTWAATAACRSRGMSWPADTRLKNEAGIADRRGGGWPADGLSSESCLPCSTSAGRPVRPGTGRSRERRSAGTDRVQPLGEIAPLGGGQEAGQSAEGCRPRHSAPAAARQERRRPR